MELQVNNFSRFPSDWSLRCHWKSDVQLKLGTGADTNAKDEKTFIELFPEAKLDSTVATMDNYGNNGNDIVIHGKFQCCLRREGSKYKQTFYVTNTNCKWYISCPSIVKQKQ